MKEAYRPPKDNRTLFKAIQVIVTGFLVALVIFGGIKLVSRDDLALKREMTELSQFLSNPSKYIEGDDVKTYAEGFIRAYLTYKGDGKYSEDLSGYLVGSLGAPNFPSGLKGIKVLETKTTTVEKINESEITVRVKAIYSQTLETPSDKGPTLQETERTSFFDVYVYKAPDSKLAIAMMPDLVPAPERAAEVKLKNLTLPSADSNVSSGISRDVESFFKAYYGGSENDIAFFTEGGKPMRGFNGAYQLKEITKVNAYVTNTNELLADVSLTITDGVLDVNQSFETVLIRAGDKYLIKSFAINNKDFNKYIKEEQK